MRNNLKVQVVLEHILIPLKDKKKFRENEFPAIGTLYFLKGLIKL